MKEVMTTNIYDIDETIIIAGTCLKSMQPNGYKKLEKFLKIYILYVLKILMSIWLSQK